MVASAILVCATLVVLGSVHFYWALGGRAFKAAAIPSLNGKAVIVPGPASTALVGAALFAMTALVAGAAGILPMPTFAGPAAQQALRWATGVLALVFLARAIGDFRYVGFFKRVRGSVFATRDTYVYSPLCLVLAGLVGIVAVGFS